MATETTNLGVTHIEEGQNQKEVTANTAFDKFDGAIAGLATIDLTGLSGIVTPDTDTMLQAMVIKTTGAMAGAVDLVVPDNRKVYMVVNNATGFNTTVKTAAGTGIALAPTNAQFLYCDGTNVIAISAIGSSGVVQALEKTAVFVTGIGGTGGLAIGANVDPATVESYADGIRLKLGAGKDYQVTESVPASGNFDELTPEYSDAIPSGADVEILYYS